jgi:hypothetical protein
MVVPRLFVASTHAKSNALLDTFKRLMDSARRSSFVRVFSDDTVIILSSQLQQTFRCSSAASWSAWALGGNLDFESLITASLSRSAPQSPFEHPIAECRTPWQFSLASRPLWRLQELRSIYQVSEKQLPLPLACLGLFGRWRYFAAPLLLSRHRGLQLLKLMIV